MVSSDVGPGVPTRRSDPFTRPACGHVPVLAALLPDSPPTGGAC